ncbi:MAG: tyrosine-type recombinase/integrase [Pseudonocardiaceae bacterium]
MTGLATTDLDRRLEEYLSIRRSLGFKLERDGKLLAQFIGYLHDQGADTVTVEDAVMWVSLPAGGRGWLAFRMSVVRGFAAYLHTLDPAVPVPPADLFPAGPHRAVPYLYSAEDLAALITATDTLRYPLQRSTYRTLVGLLAVSGLRVGEAIGLDDTDLDIEHGVLSVTGKFGKPRQVPLHSSSVAALRAYQRRRRATHPHPSTPALLVSTPGTRLSYLNVSATFVKLVRRAGLAPRSASCRPRPHDLRHSFAVATLLDWYRDGGDVAARLPLLSTYLGNVDPANTYWYLHEPSGIASDGRESAGCLMRAVS